MSRPTVTQRTSSAVVIAARYGHNISVVEITDGISRGTLSRLFRTNVDQHIKRNLIIFVTARLVNPAGQPVNQTEEEEEQETVQPPVLPEIPAYKK